LEELTEELITTKKIIQLLQEDLNPYKGLMSGRTSKERSNSYVSSNPINDWELLTDKSRKSNRTVEQLPIPVISTTKCFNALNTLQNDLELPCNTQNHHIKNHHIKKNIFLKHNKAISSPIRRKMKILLIGDSHRHGCASELKKYLGTIMPGLRLQNITKLAKNETAGFLNTDAIIIWGGSNNSNRNETMKVLKYLNDFVNQRKNTKVMIVTAPHILGDYITKLMSCYTFGQLIFLINCFTEHHLCDHEINSTCITYYNFGAKHCRKSYKYGGESIFVHETLLFSTVEMNEFCKDQDLEICAVKLHISSFVLCIMCVHRAPIRNFSYFF
jgi:hypothetical protein